MLSTVFTRPFRRYRPALTRPSILSRLVDLDQTFRNKRKLERLDDHLRQDIGLSRTEVKTEFDRPLWDIPTWWR